MNKSRKGIKKQFIVELMPSETKVKMIFTHYRNGHFTQSIYRDDEFIKRKEIKKEDFEYLYYGYKKCPTAKVKEMI